jgi:hypothetical protein
MTLWNSASAAGIVCAVLGVLLLILTLPGARWDARAAPRQKEHVDLKELTNKFYKSEPKGNKTYRAPQYDRFAPALVVAPGLGRGRERPLARCERARDLPEETYKLGCDLAIDWAGKVGQLARALKEKRLATRRFLQTYHLAFIRECSLALPFLVCKTKDGELEDDLIDYAAYAIALADLAAFYNSLARQQRQAVRFLANEDQPDLGLILPAPGPLSRLFLTPLDLVYGDLRLRQLRVKRAKMDLGRLASELASK